MNIFYRCFPRTSAGCKFFKNISTFKMMLRYFPCFLKNVIGLRNILIRGRDFGPQVESSRSFFPIYNRSLHTSNSQDLDKTESEVLAKLQESISEDYVPFQNQQRIIQDVIDEIWNPAPVSSHVEYKPSPEFLQRGKTGVFDLAELVDLLRKENCIEVVTIGIPKETDYADHMIIVTCRGPRHLLAVATYVRKRFKMKDLKKSDILPTIVSRTGVQGWIALDLGNIVLHLFLQQQRDYYDLEMLWTVGRIFDDLCNTQDPEIIQLLNLLK